RGNAGKPPANGRHSNNYQAFWNWIRPKKRRMKASTSHDGRFESATSMRRQAGDAHQRDAHLAPLFE
ncbi:hypothetical protein BC831DRAFT_447946, partial [Entophlyctis helioformis]